jgi:Tfp pilus assembly PilM family ATPase
MDSLFEDGPNELKVGPKSRKKILPNFGRTARMTGLDVGSTMIKAVVFERQADGIVLRQTALDTTPPGVVTAGVLTDGITVARALKSLWSDYSMQDQRVASAVSGDRVFCQMDETKGRRDMDLDRFVEDKIAETLSYPPDSASSGYQEVPGGAVWAAAPVESIDWIRETVQLSSKTPVSIETQSCALDNAYSFSYQPGTEDVVLLVHVGAQRASLVLMRGEVPLYGRDVVTNGDWPVVVTYPRNINQT